MSKINRRELLIAAAATSACGRSELADMTVPAKFVQVRPPYNKNPVYHQRPPASPIHLSSSLVLASGTSGAPSQTALKNPMGQDMELLEIKFELSGGLQSAHAAVFGGTIWCELVMGNINLTNGSIPVWNFGRAENLEGESKSDLADSLTFLSYSWRLPRPLFIPAGATVVPTFVHTGYVPDSINVRVGYSCRTVFTKPKKLCVPWVANYASKVFNPLSSAGIDSSSELDLVNPNPEVLHLQRFVGRTLTLAANGSAGENFPQSFGSQYLTMRMIDSYGRPTVQNFTPFRSVFGALTRSWEMDNGAELDPESYYIVSLKQNAIALNTDGWMGQAFVSMVGWRELENS